MYKYNFLKITLTITAHLGIDVCVYSVLSDSVTSWTIAHQAGYSVYGILQARTLEQAAISYLRGSFWPRNQIYVLASLALQVNSLSLCREALTSLIALIYMPSVILKKYTKLNVIKWRLIVTGEEEGCARVWWIPWPLNIFITFHISALCCYIYMLYWTIKL